MNEETLRGTGRTTKQIEAAPHGAVFVWVNSSLYYPRSLAMHLNRADLRIESPDFLECGRWQGLRLYVVIDHAFLATGRHRRAVDELAIKGLLIE